MKTWLGVCLLVGVALGFMVRIPTRPDPLKPELIRVVHFHGKFGALRFCEDDDGELFSEGGMLGVECADQRHPALTLTNSTDVTFRAWGPPVWVAE